MCLSALESLTEGGKGWTVQLTPRGTREEKGMPGENYASGNWRVKEGSEEEFIARWRAWITASTEMVNGFDSAKLLRDSDDARRFLSFSHWDDGESRDKWKTSPEFAKGLAACRELCDDFQGADFSGVVSV